MDTIKKLTVASLMLVLAVSCFAQSAFDMYGPARTLVLAAPTAYASGTSTLLSNAPVDIRGCIGTAKIDFYAYTVGTGTLTAEIAVSNDETNWTSLPNYSLATRSLEIVTNLYWGNYTNVQAQNPWNLPGTVTTPTAATSGFATAYLLSAPFTNTGPASLTANTVTTIGFNIVDCPRYIRVQWSGTATQGVTAAVLTTRRSQLRY